MPDSGISSAFLVSRRPSPEAMLQALQELTPPGIKLLRPFFEQLAQMHLAQLRASECPACRPSIAQTLREDADGWKALAIKIFGE